MTSAWPHHIWFLWNGKFLPQFPFEKRTTRNPPINQNEQNMKTLQLMATIAISAIIQNDAFAPITPTYSHAKKQQHTLTSSVLYAKEPRTNALESRTCIRNFLTQRCLQSFMFLLKEMRDSHTNAWLSDFLGNNNLLSFHGSGALDLNRFCTWDNVFNELMKTPLDAVIVEVKPRGQGRGLSKNNPYRMLEVSLQHVEYARLHEEFGVICFHDRILSPSSWENSAFCRNI